MKYVLGEGFEPPKAQGRLISLTRAFPSGVDYLISIVSLRSKALSL